MSIVRSIISKSGSGSGRLLPFLVLCIFMCSCCLEDCRDTCCALRMYYRYMPYGSDEFPAYIHSLRHFLFDSGGVFLAEIPSDVRPDRLELDLPEGVYTLVSVGNYGEHSHCEGMADGGLDGFVLHLSDAVRHSPDSHDCADELYWGFISFEMDSRGRAREIVTEYSTRSSKYTPSTSYSSRMVFLMNNIHCHLSVRVYWRNMPLDIGDYEIELRNVTAGYSLDPENSLPCQSGFRVPSCSSCDAVHSITVPLKSQELQGEFVTLRYTDDSIPSLRVRFGEKEITPEIPLEKAFREWGWYPDRTHVQKYRIQIEIVGDGTVVVRPWGDTAVDDWIDGGTVS